MENNWGNFDKQQERRNRREGQRRNFSRNQAIGLLLIAAAVLIYRLFHTPSGWLFPPGWWKW